MRAHPAIRWPDGKRFAFTVFDDPDSQPLEESRVIYGFLRDAGFRTTKGVWPLGPYREGELAVGIVRESGVSSACSRFAEGTDLKSDSTARRCRPHRGRQTQRALELFREYFDSDPAVMSNHFYNQEGIYWGPARLSGMRRLLYRLATAHQRPMRYSGHVAEDPYYWGTSARSMCGTAGILFFRKSTR